MTSRYGIAMACLSIIVTELWDYRRFCPIVWKLFYAELSDGKCNVCDVFSGSEVTSTPGQQN